MGESETPSRWSNLSEEQKAKLEQKLRTRLKRQDRPKVIQPRPEGCDVPLSHTQERLWFLDQLNPGTIIYNRPWGLHFLGHLDHATLHKCLQEIIHRHEALRTTFTSQDGKPFQVVQPPKGLDLPCTDLRQFPQGAGANKVSQFCQQEVVRPFDITQDLMLRPHLIQIDEDEHILLLTTHHIAFDGWSERILLHELSHLYEAFVSGQPSPLSDPAIQFPDYAYWEKNILLKNDLNRHIAFWKKELEGAPPFLEMKTDHPRPAKPSNHGSHQTILFDAERTRSIKSLCQSEGLTLYMTMLSAFNLLLFLHSGLTDIVLGTPVAGRRYRELEEVIGFFVNTLVVRTTIDPDLTLRQFLKHVQNKVLAAIEYQDMPFDKLVEILNPPRHTHYTPIVQATFALRNIPIPKRGFKGLAVRDYKFDSGIARFDLGMEVEEYEGQLSCSLNFCHDLFNDSSVARMMELFQEIVDNFIRRPDNKISQLSDLTEMHFVDSKSKFTIQPDEAFIKNSNLTGTQVLTWLGHKFRPNEPVYNLVYTFTIHSQIETTHFQRAFQALLSDSDALRTVIQEKDGIPYQMVKHDLIDVFEVMDYSKEEQPQAMLDKWIETQSKIPFDFSERLIASALIKLSSEKWVWFLKVHHLIADNWAIRLIFNRMQMLYEKSRTGRLAERIKPPQFAEFISSERRYRETPDFKKTALYWSQKFSNPVQPLIYYGLKLTNKDISSQRISLDLGQERTQRLRQVASLEQFFIKSEDASLLNIFSTLLLAYLHRATGNDDLTVGISLHNRRTSQAKDTIGLFMETLPLRVRVEDGETFRSLHRKVTADTVTTLQHRIFPIRNPIQSPIYGVALNFHQVSYEKFLDREVEYKRACIHFTEDPLTLFIQDYSGMGSFTIDFDLNCDTFPAQIRKYVIQHFMNLLDAFLAGVDIPINDVDLVPENERKHILFGYNRTDERYPDSKTIHQCVEEQVLKSPDKIAVICGEDTLTYAQLNSKANQLAHYLRDLNLQPEEPVALFLGRSPELLIAMLATLKAGGAYLPLDINLPKKRLAFMLAEARANIVLTKEDVWDRLPEPNMQVLTLDEWGEFDTSSSENPVSGLEPTNLAYIIFTSGSTGVPKGVMIEHRSVVNFMHWAAKNWALTQEDRILQFASVIWDTHVEEIFPGLISGSTLILRTETMLDTFQTFITESQNLDISVMDLPTAYWHALSRAMVQDGLKLPDSLRLIIIGGEKASKDQMDVWFQHIDQEIRLVNTYGLTECTCVSTQFDLTENYSPQMDTVPIGQPIQNVQTYVLDRNKHILQVDLPGELWIGGGSLARGYLNRDEWAKDRFRRNFLKGTPGDRLFKTGDLARYDSEGNLEILGRIDHQVKVRGYRIELEEIEAALNQHEAVKESVVVTRNDDREGKMASSPSEHLVAYYIPWSSSDLDSGPVDFRSFLRATLPEYMLPSFFIPLVSFPLTPSGKVDRNELPLPEISQTEDEKNCLKPPSQLEQRLVAIWEDVLQKKSIGLTNSFFDLGGHSLLAVRLFSRIEKELGVTLPLLSLFESPTISHQAQLIQNQVPNQIITTAVVVQPYGKRPPFFCISPSVIDVVTYRQLAKNMGDDQPFYALYSTKLGEWRQNPDLRESIADQFIQKILEITPKGPFCLGGYSAGGAVALEIAQHLREANRDVGLLVLFDTFGPSYPLRLPWVTPWIFNILLAIRRIESYFWKFRMLDWKGRMDYLRLPRIRSWLRDRYGEVRPPMQMKTEQNKSQITLGRRDYDPKPYDGDVLLIRAEKGLLGIKKDPKMGWGEIFTGTFEILMVPGDHEAILFGPRSQHVAKKLVASLNKATERFR